MTKWNKRDGDECLSQLLEAATRDDGRVVLVVVVDDGNAKWSTLGAGKMD